MNTTEMLTISLVVALGCVIVCASHIISSITWFYCPKCRRYHSDLGITDRPPIKGKIHMKPKCCPDCR